jgi:hypothetical protein
MARKKIQRTPDEQIQAMIGSIVVDSEYKVAATLQDSENLEFESLIDILEGKRNEKDYEWMSDYSIPELISIIQTEASSWASVMFQTRDFCEVKLDGDNPNDFDKARAAKTCLNKTLNIRDIYYYPKYMRLRLINALRGHCYIVCWWEQALREEETEIMSARTEMRQVPDPTTGQMVEKPFVIREPKKVKYTHLVTDHFNCDVVEPRTGSNIKIGIHDTGGTTTEITPNIASANTYQTVTWDISAVADANKDAIDKIIATIVNADAGNTFFTDNMYGDVITNYLTRGRSRFKFSGISLGQ